MANILAIFGLSFTDCSIYRTSADYKGVDNGKCARIDKLF